MRYNRKDSFCVRIKFITRLDDLYEHDLSDSGVWGDLYEYMLDELNSAGQNGQFHTPKHIREIMMALVQPTPGNLICKTKTPI